MTVTAPTLMTTEELLAMPDDGVERWLIRGQLREQKSEHRSSNGTTVRNRDPSRVMTRAVKFLSVWLDAQPEPRGEILGGGVGVRLRRTPDSTVGIAVIYADVEVAARPDEHKLIDGAPVLAVEILSPTDTQESINEKIDEYLDAGVRLVWRLDPHDRTVTIYRPGRPTEAVNETQELTGDPELPGFRVAVARLFS